MNIESFIKKFNNFKSNLHSTDTEFIIKCERLQSYIDKFDNSKEYLIRLNRTLEQLELEWIDNEIPF